MKSFSSNNLLYKDNLKINNEYLDYQNIKSNILEQTFNILSIIFKNKIKYFNDYYDINTKYEKTHLSKIFEIHNIKEKKIKFIIKKIITFLDEFFEQIQFLLNKFIKRKEQFLNQCSINNELIFSLKKTIDSLNKENSQLVTMFKEKSDDYEKLQNKINFFQENENLFNKFKKEFPNKNLIEIMNEIDIRKNTSLNLLNEFNNLQYKYELLEKEKKNIDSKYQKIIFDLNIKNDNIENLKKNSETNFKNKIEEFESEINLYKSKEEENKFLTNMLFQIYNLLFEEFRLDKNIKIKKEFLNVNEKNFDPGIFSNIELFNYIKLMIKSMKENSAGKELRETIAYANLMARNYLPEKINLKYQPSLIFKEIKELIDKKEEKIQKLETENKLINDKIKNLEKENGLNKTKYKDEQRKFENYQKIVDKIIVKESKYDKNNLILSQTIPNSKIYLKSSNNNSKNNSRYFNKNYYLKKKIVIDAKNINKNN
jgi:hypothetical protein